MTRFQTCFRKVLGHEGKLSDRKADRGGRTNYGVTQKKYDEYRLGHKLKKQPVDLITAEEIEAVYLSFWQESNCAVLPEPLDLLVFDTAINSGSSRAIKLLQNVLDVTEDGKLGQVSMKALHDEAVCVGVGEIYKAYLGVRGDFMKEIVRRDPTQQEFLAGWLNRLGKLAREIA